jgi:hypothetical protein
MKLVPVDLPATMPTPLAQLAQANQTGAFMTATQRGLIVLLVDRTRNFEEFRADFRKFALDSDVVLGAIRIGDRHLAFVGREREATLAAMPPLRFETARLLVTTAAPELAQSYERSQLFAGRLTDGEFKDFDWAPIYLSPVAGAGKHRIRQHSQLHRSNVEVVVERGPCELSWLPVPSAKSLSVRRQGDKS